MKYHNPEKLRVRKPYRLLTVEELEKLPEDTQFHSSGRWYESDSRGKAAIEIDRHETTYRTKTPLPVEKPNPGKGYRLLKAGEKIKVGDELYSEYSLGWVRSNSVGYILGKSGTKSLETGKPFPYRRKIESPAAERVDSPPPPQVSYCQSHGEWIEERIQTLSAALYQNSPAFDKSKYLEWAKELVRHLESL